MRRKDKEITDPGEIEEILSTNNICRIAFSDSDMPYIVPMNYGYLGNRLFLHSAAEGRKTEIIKNNNRICFEISDSVEIVQSEIACDFGTKYRSVIGFGTIRAVSDPDKKTEALRIIMKQHTDRRNWQFSEKLIPKIIVLEVEINSISGKKSGL